MASDRAGSKRAELLEPGDRLLLLGIKQAKVVRNVKMVEHGAIYATGPAAAPRYVYWNELTLEWDEEGLPDSPRFFICYPGDRYLRIRD